MYPDIVIAAKDTRDDLKSLADYVCDGTDDNQIIQFGTDKIQDTILLPGIYNISETITVPPLVDLKLKRGAVLEIVENVDGVYISRNSSISGGCINTRSLATWDKSAILAHGNEQFSIDRKMWHGITNASNISIIGTHGTQTGCGLRFVADNPGGYPNPDDNWSFATGLRFFNIHIFNMRDGIKVDILAEDKSAPHFFNGNSFYSLYLMRCVNSINLTGGSIAGNIFTDVQIQAGKTSKRAIYVNSHNNFFNGVVVYDWTMDEPIIEFGPKGRANLIIGKLDHKRILDGSEKGNNVVHDMDKQKEDNLGLFHNANIIRP
jgi:hypothetical protein